jgi:hypothetical protein
MRLRNSSYSTRCSRKHPVVDLRHGKKIPNPHNVHNASYELLCRVRIVLDDENAPPTACHGVKSYILYCKLEIGN